jgi:hypothetical protein
MACSCDSCSSPRIIKTRTATFWRWLAQNRGETADRVILAPARAVAASVAVGLTDQGTPNATAQAQWDTDEKETDRQLLDRRRAEFLEAVRPPPLA